MGIAEVIPGVSGGTIAFITGIYERLINVIKNVLGPEIFLAFREEGLMGAWKRIDATFLLTLLFGMVLGIGVGVFGVSHLLAHYPVLLWAFFFGLIVASAIYIGRLVNRWSFREVSFLVAGTVIAFIITVATPAQGSAEPWFVFLAGAIAISALILPGISGSFMLLLMGMYTLIIPTLKRFLETFDTALLGTLIFFGLGCLTGLASFARLLSWTFRRYRDLTLATLTGFMLGSLNKIWPWRNVLSYRTNSSGEEVPFLERSVWPGAYDGEPMVFGALFLMLAGVGIVFLLDWYDRQHRGGFR